MRDADKYSWDASYRRDVQLRLPRERHINWGPVIGAGLVVLTGFAFWSAVYHWVSR